MRLLGTLLLTLMTIVSAQAQLSLKEANIWYFRRTGLQFFHNQGGDRPIALSNSNPAFNTVEGGGTVCDTGGNLIAYSDGMTVWNRQHQQMLNGTGLTGGRSSVQNAIILRKPGSHRYYYVFTVDEAESGFAGNQGFRYSVIDITLDGGNGGIIDSLKNILIEPNISEKVSAVLHRDGVKIWVASHGWPDNRFPIALIDTGRLRIDLDRVVINRIGPNQVAASAAGTSIMRGSVKFSPNGNRFAATTTEHLNIGGTVGYWVQVMKFNNETGELFDHVSLSVPREGTGLGSIQGPYGLEFSPDNTKLYCAKRVESSTSRIYQWEMCENDSASMNNSRFTVNTQNAMHAALQLGPDMRIYATRGFVMTLASIDAPNEPGAACRYNPDAVTITSTADRGLNNINQSLFDELGALMQYSDLCEGQTVNFTGAAKCQGVVNQFRWNFGDPESGAANTSTDQFTTHRFTRPGIYRVTLIVQGGNNRDSIVENVRIEPRARGAVNFDRLACFGTHEYSFVLDTAGQGAAGIPTSITNYRWVRTGAIDTTYEGPGRPSISITYDTNQRNRYELYLYTTTQLGEQCESGPITFDVLTNERKSAMPFGPDTVCLVQNQPIVFRSTDAPRGQFSWRYQPLGDGAFLEGLNESELRITNPRPGRKTIQMEAFRDTVNQICYAPSDPVRLFVAAPAGTQLTLTGDSAICENINVRYNAQGSEPGSQIIWTLSNPAMGTVTPVVGAESGEVIDVQFANLALGRNVNFLEAREVSRDGCEGPVARKEVYDSCLELGTIATVGGDGLNDNFNIRNVEIYPDNRLEVYSRWGRRVVDRQGYRNEDITSNLEPGMYYYFFTVQYEGRTRRDRGWFEVVK